MASGSISVTSSDTSCDTIIRSLVSYDGRRCDCRCWAPRSHARGKALATCTVLLAAIAIPAYQDYTARAVLAQAAAESQQARQQLTQYYLNQKSVPESLTRAGITDQLPNGVQLTLDPNGMVLTVHSKRGDLVYTP